MKEEGAVVSGSSRVTHLIMSENKNEFSIKGESIVKEEDLEMCEQAEQAINAAIKAVESATEVVFKIKIQANELISVDDVTDPLLFAVKCCRDSKEALEKSTDFWQEILREREELLEERNEMLEEKEGTKGEVEDLSDNITDEIPLDQDDFEMLTDQTSELDMIVVDIMKNNKFSNDNMEKDQGLAKEVIEGETGGCSDDYDHMKDEVEYESENTISKDEPVNISNIKFQPVCSNAKNCKCDICILTISQNAKSKPRRKYSQYVREVNGNHECIFCNISMPTTKFNRMREHIKMKHLQPPDSKFKCDQCDYVNEYEASVTEHKNAVHEGITFPCTWEGCSHRSNRQRNLKKHMDVVHLKQIPNLSCKWCPYTAKQSKALKRHVMKEHPEKDDKFYCDECMFVSMSSKGLTTHIAQAHTFERARVKGQTKSLLWVHDETEQTYKCRECTFITSYPSSIYSHFQRKHQKEKYLCDKCDFTATIKYNLDYHYQDKHTDQILKCDSCDFTTSHKLSMKRHMRKHEGKVLSCDYEGCNYLANFKSDLQIHINIVHEKIRQHCPECNFSARRTGDLNRHVMKVHGNKAGVIYSCDRCVFKTANENFLTLHLKKNHEIISKLSQEQRNAEPQDHGSVKKDLDSPQIS